MADKEPEIDKNLKAENSEAPVTDQERDWGVSALSDFSKGNYSACLQTLAKLEVARPQDIKVSHNKAIVEYYKSDLKKTDLFKKNMNIVCAQGKVNIDNLIPTKAVDHCVIFFNQAVLLYHLKQYDSALKIMNKVFTFVEPMEESLAHRVCLLLIELHLCTHQPARALNLITYIETQFVCTDSVISADKDMKPLEKEHREKKPAVSVDAATDAFRLRLLQYRTRCYLMLRQLKACKRELKSILSSGGLSLSTVFLKSNLEYLRHNYKKATKVLNSIPPNNAIFKETGESIAVLYYNNNGCIHHYLGKPNLANFYLHKALVENDNAMQSLPKPDQAEPNSGRPMYTLGANHRYALMYNLGVSLLHSGRPLKAFDCLTEAIQVYHMNPRLWLRLAECCIVAHKTHNEDDFNLALRRNDLVHSVVGTGPHRKIILNPKLNCDTKYSSEGQGFAVGLLVASLEFASLCLRNALLLLPDETIPPPETPEHPHSGYYAAPSSPMNASEVASLRCSVLVASAYVNLCLGEYVIALGHAKELLALPTLSGRHRLLGHLYSAEALILLDRLSESIEHLHPEIASDLNVDIMQEKDLDSSTDEAAPLSAWYPNTISTARVVLRYNLAVVYALRGELDKATEVLQNIWMSKSPGCDVPIHVVMLALYVELQLGHSDLSRSIVKQHLPQYR